MVTFTSDTGGDTGGTLDAARAVTLLDDVWRVDALLRAAERRPIELTRLGYPGEADKRRLAEAIGADDEAAQHTIDIAIEAGLIAPTDDVIEAPGVAALRGTSGDKPPTIRPTSKAEGWNASDPAARWATLTGASTKDEAAVRRALPEPVDQLVLQGDLTGVVPGLPAGDVAAVIALATEVESRGAATTVRFTPASIARAIATGLTAKELQEKLKAYSATPLPQPLAYLIKDTARTARKPKFATSTDAPPEPSAPLLRADDRAALRKAMSSGADVIIELAVDAGQTRQITPVRYAHGRLRALDPVREIEITVAASQIVRVECVTPDPAGDDAAEATDEADAK